MKGRRRLRESPVAPKRRNMFNKYGCYAMGVKLKQHREDLEHGTLDEFKTHWHKFLES